MLSFDSDAPFDHDRRLAALTGVRSGHQRRDAINTPKSLEISRLPNWLRTGGEASDGASAAFFAGAGIALFDQILRGSAHGADVSSAAKDSAEPSFSGTLRQRLALKAAASCARRARLREDEAALRDAEHLGGVGVETSPAGRVHRLWRLFATRAVKFDAATLSLAAEHLRAAGAVNVEELAGALRDGMAKAENPLAAAARASATAMNSMEAVAAVDAEIFALWLADVALAQKLGWKAPLPLLAIMIAHPALRRDSNGRRPHPGERDWFNTLAGAYALAAREAVDLAVDLSRHAEKLRAAAPKLRVKGAARVIDMLLADDCLTPARAAKRAKLSDRAARRLFDRLIEVGVVRELSGRATFRLYGL